MRIETERLTLRDWCAADWPAFAAMNADPAVMAHLDGPIDRAASDAVMERQAGFIARDGIGFHAIERRADGVLLGFCGLRIGGHPDTPVAGELEIGWRLARHAWGAGYAREAAAAWIAHGWAGTDRARIAAWTVAANTASWGLMLRLGMARRVDLDFDHPAFPPGHPLRRHIVHAIDRPGVAA